MSGAQYNTQYIDCNWAFDEATTEVNLWFTREGDDKVLQRNLGAAEAVSKTTAKAKGQSDVKLVFGPTKKYTFAFTNLLHEPPFTTVEECNGKWLF